ncbi:MAG: guanylate kinase [Candidatus Fermentibacteria bacterium]|nr:guanylate kinase [Candidatus Fermentibacteria bacterium]
MFSSGMLFVLAGPSGAGKTTLAHHLVGRKDGTVFSVSTTTRASRGEEIHGEDYFFVDDEEFSRRIESSYFLEWAHVHGNRYGTEGAWVREQMARGRSVILDIDVQGAVQVKEAMPSAVLIFVLPASSDVLRERLEQRNTDSEKTVEKRMKAAAGEVSFMGVFDYFVCNDVLEEAKSEVESIFLAESMRLCNIGWPVQALDYHRGYTSGLSFWRGKRVVVASGPTREMIDDVRFVSNRSSGLMGVSMAEAFLAAGAGVVLVSGPAFNMEPPGPVRLVKVRSASDMRETLREEVVHADLLVMAAAVADFTPVSSVSGKLKREEGSISLALEPTPDITRSLGSSCPVISFALEYGDGAVERAREKMKRKNSFAIFLNMGDEPEVGMETACNSGTLLFASTKKHIEIPFGSKKFVAFGIVSALGREMEKSDNE